MYVFWLESMQYRDIISSNECFPHFTHVTRVCVIITDLSVYNMPYNVKCIYLSIYTSKVKQKLFYWYFSIKSFIKVNTGKTISKTL